MSSFILLLGLQLSTSIARADEAPPAIPVQEAPPAVAPAPRPVPVGPPRHSAQKLDALRQYQQERLSIRPETSYSGGGTMVVGGYWAGGWRPTPWGGAHFGYYVPGAVISEPVTAQHSWGVYRGPERMTTPDLLRAGGDDVRASDLESDIHHAKTASTLWYGAAGVGLATALTGMMGLATVAEDRQDAQFFSQVALGGAGVAAIGLFGGSFPAAKARRLRYDTADTLSVDEAHTLIRHANEDLRNKLGLSPDDVWSVESAPVVR